MTSVSNHDRRGRHVPVGPVSAAEIVVLGLLAAYVVLVALPSVFTIESDCFGSAGLQRISGDRYFASATVLGTFGWIGVAIGALYAMIADSRRFALLLPVLWFVVFVGGFLAFAAAIGPAVCPI